MSHLNAHGRYNSAAAATPICSSDNPASAHESNHCDRGKAKRDAFGYVHESKGQESTASAIEKVSSQACNQATAFR